LNECLVQTESRAVPRRTNTYGYRRDPIKAFQSAKPLHGVRQSVNLLNLREANEAYQA